MIRNGLICKCGSSDFRVTQSVLDYSISMNCEKCGLVHLIAITKNHLADCVNEKRDFYNPSVKVT